jgi:endonuclease/exonuclease/phosphatase family metal-dependent hydrolase
MVIHELKDPARCPPISCSRRKRRASTAGSGAIATGRSPQHEFIADTVWHEVAYGRNADYHQGHHGNAVLSRFPIISQSNRDISAHAFESRGMLHCVLQLKRGLPPLHCINIHLGLFERGRRWQVHALCERIREVVPMHEPLIIAGTSTTGAAR